MLEEGSWRSVAEALETFSAFLEGVRRSFAARSMSVPKDIRPWEWRYVNKEALGVRKTEMYENVGDWVNF